ncbi:MAG: hypothetical protein ACXWOH_12725 [Bdellovibrionota bacterium]
MDEQNRPLSEIVSSTFHVLQLYASLILGWYFFHRFIYPVAYDTSMVSWQEPGVIVPVYAANAGAFGCAVYLGTQPLLTMASAVIGGMERAIKRNLR